MRLESKETIYILRGDYPFKGGERFQWQACSFNAQKVTFRTTRKIISAPLDEIFMDYKLKVSNSSGDRMIVENTLPGSQLFKPMAIEISKN